MLSNYCWIPPWSSCIILFIATQEFPKNITCDCCLILNCFKSSELWLTGLYGVTSPTGFFYNTTTAPFFTGTMLIRACQRYSPWRGGEAWLWRGLSWCSSSPKSARARQEWRRYRGRGVWMEMQWIHKELLTSEVCSCHLGLLHCFLDPLHDCNIQHLEVTGCPADGADWVTF